VTFVNLLRWTEVTAMEQAHTPQRVTALFRKVPDAVRAYEWLRGRGFQESEINVLLSEKTRDAFHQAVHNERVESNRDSSPQAESAGAVGVAAGAGLFALAGATLAGLGLVVAGPIVAALAGGAVGAMVGGLAGGLIGYGFPEESARAYDQVLREEGAVALGVQSRDEEDARLIVQQLQSLGGENVIGS
jgi:hypothetical protein